VKGAMLAGALFNRAADLLTKAVELQALGTDMGPEDPLLRQCGDHLQEALSLGRLVLHRSGEEGIDELWGEPLKAFAFPIEEFYKSRYLKIAATMRDIDRIADALVETFESVPGFAGIIPAKVKSETLQTDPSIFDTWAAFVTAGERLVAFEPVGSQRASINERLRMAQGRALIAAGAELVGHVTRARVPMPKSTRDYLERLERYRATWAPQIPGREGTEQAASVVVGDARAAEEAAVHAL